MSPLAPAAIGIAATGLVSVLVIRRFQRRRHARRGADTRPNPIPTEEPALDDAIAQARATMRRIDRDGHERKR